MPSLVKKRKICITNWFFFWISVTQSWSVSRAKSFCFTLSTGVLSALHKAPASCLCLNTFYCVYIIYWNTPKWCPLYQLEWVNCPGIYELLLILILFITGKGYIAWIIKDRRCWEHPYTLCVCLCWKIWDYWVWGYGKSCWRGWNWR